MAVLDRPATHTAARPVVDLGSTLSCYRHGRNDPTTWIDRIGHGTSSAGRFVRATWTPDGPATLLVRWSPDTPVHAETWGDGGEWLLARVPSMLGDDDAGAPELELDAHPVVARCAQAHRSNRIGASSTLYHELLPTVIEQRVTTVEAKQQWATLCRELSDAAPGPFAGLVLPPAPHVLRRQPSWWFHPIGIERTRAQTLIEVARHASKMWAWADLPSAEASRLLRMIPGVGVWTVGCVLAPALGDPDAVPVGDYHVKNVVAWNLAGEARASDDRMLQLLEGYVGQRGRVVNSILQHGNGAPKYGPKHRILPMRRW